MCEDHTRLIPQANREELMRTFEDWKKRLRPRGYYVAARIRTIVAVAQAQSRTPPASLTEILRLLDSGEWRPRG